MLVVLTVVGCGNMGFNSKLNTQKKLETMLLKR